MEQNDKVKLSIYCKVTGVIVMIVSYQDAINFREDVKRSSTASLYWLDVKGRLNDIDGNVIESCINIEDIASFDILEINSKF